MADGSHSNITTSKMKKKKTIITEEQEQVIKRLMSEGLLGTGKKYSRLLNQAVRETGLPLPVICRKVHNLRRAKKSRKQSATPARKHMYARRLSGYNLFCHEIGSQSSDGTLRQQIWGQKWAALTKEEQLVYIKRAEAMNNTPLSELRGEQKQAAINISTAAIIYHMERLQTLQPGHGLFIYTDTKTFVSSACGNGRRVLADQHVELQTELSQGLDVEIESSSEVREHLRKAVTSKMMETYGKFLGKNRPKRFPYGAYSRDETSFRIEGLPEGFVLLKASQLNASELQTVLDSTLTYVSRPTDRMETSPVPNSSFDRDTHGVAGETTPSQPFEVPMEDGPALPLPTEEEDVSSPQVAEDFPVESEEATLIETTTYQFSVSENSLANEASSSLEYEVVPLPSNGQEFSKNDEIVTVPHPTPEEAMESARKLAKAIEERNTMCHTGRRRSSRSNDNGQSILEFLLGKTVAELWTVKNKGKRNSKEWYDGIVVQKTAGDFAIKFDDSEELYPLSARKAAYGIKKGTLRIVDVNGPTN